MSNLFSKSMMRVIKSLIGTMPKSARVKMRQQLWLHNLYSKSLQKSGVFYGYPSPQKSQKLYVKNIAKQDEKIKNNIEIATNKRQINFLIVLSGQQDADFQTIQNVLLHKRGEKIFLAGETNYVRQCCENITHLSF